MHKLRLCTSIVYCYRRACGFWHHNTFKR